jgi:hypothetical protein
VKIEMPDAGFQIPEEEVADKVKSIEGNNYGGIILFIIYPASLIFFSQAIDVMPVSWFYLLGHNI